MSGRELPCHYAKFSYQQQVSRGLVDPRNFYTSAHVGFFEDSSGFVKGEPDASGYLEERLWENHQSQVA